MSICNPQVLGLGSKQHGFPQVNCASTGARMSQFVAVIKALTARGITAEVQMTSLEMFDPNGKDCGAPLYLNGYEEASELLRIAGVSAQELDKSRLSFESGKEVRFAVPADSYIVDAMGFKPRL